MSRQIRVGIVGAGGAAQIVHLPILKRLPQVEVSGLADPVLGKAKTIAERFEVPHAAATLETLLSDVALDAVLICNPTDAHEEAVLESLEAGLHVLCERPLSVSSESVERLLAAAAAAERQLMVAMNHRYSFDLRSIRQFVASGELGQPILVRSAWHNRRQRRPRSGWRCDPQLAGAGVMMDVGVQALDAALWILGYPAVERVSARFHALQPEGSVEASAVGILYLKEGASISFDVTWELQEERDYRSLQLLATEGAANSWPFRITRKMETGLADLTPPLKRSGAAMYTDSYRQEWAEFLRYARGEKALELPREQVALMRVVAACHESAREGREVVL